MFIIPQFTRKLFTDLAIGMMTLGIIIGLLFPPFTVALGFSEKLSYSLSFWIICILAGLFVAFLNYLLVNLIIRNKLVVISDHMHKVEQSIKNATKTGDWSDCTPEQCHLQINSEDELGESAQTFNELVESLFRSHEVETAISNFSKALSTQLELDKLSETALKLLLHHTASVAGMVITLHAGKERITANYGLLEPEKILTSIHIKRVQNEKQMYFITLPEDIKVEALIANFRPKEVCVIPVEFKNEVIGIVVLASSHAYQNDVHWMMKLFSQGFALALKNALIHSQLQEIAVLDGLTGVLNRHFGMKRLRQELARSQRNNASLGIIMYDLDYFKKINDEYGHLCGDHILIEVTKVTRETIRETDVIVRYGGEEFLIICQDTSETDTLTTARRLCKAVAEHRFMYEQNLIPVTISVGVASFPAKDVETTHQLIRRADDALYYSKEHGRNCFTMYGEYSCTDKNTN